MCVRNQSCAELDDIADVVFFYLIKMMHDASSFHFDLPTQSRIQNPGPSSGLNGSVVNTIARGSFTAPSGQHTHLFLISYMSSCGLFYRWSICPEINKKRCDQKNQWLDRLAVNQRLPLQSPSKRFLALIDGKRSWRVDFWITFKKFPGSGIRFGSVQTFPADKQKDQYGWNQNLPEGKKLDSRRSILREESPKILLWFCVEVHEI